MRKIALGLLVAILFLVPLTSPTPVSAHTETDARLIGDVLEYHYFGPEPNGVWMLREHAFHFYGLHYTEHCWYIGLAGSYDGPKYHALYNINTGEVHWLDYDAYCPR
jgi:hypothetical protein